MSIGPGDKAPDFDLPTDGGGRLSMTSLKGRKVVLYFYPKDDTTGCTKEAIAFGEAMKQLEKLAATVIGVSRDSVASHDKFKAKYDLPFELVSDADGTLCQAYGVWVEKSMYGRKYMGIDRSTYVIDAKGVVRHAWRKVKVPGHVDEVMAAVKVL